MTDWEIFLQAALVQLSDTECIGQVMSDVCKATNDSVWNQGRSLTFAQRALGDENIKSRKTFKEKLRALTVQHVMS